MHSYAHWCFLHQTSLRLLRMRCALQGLFWLLEDVPAHTCLPLLLSACGMHAALASRDVWLLAMRVKGLLLLHVFIGRPRRCAVPCSVCCASLCAPEHASCEVTLEQPLELWHLLTCLCACVVPSSGML